MKKRVLSLLLVLLMVIRLVPISALAEKSDTDIAYAVEGGNIYFDKATGAITCCDRSVTKAIIPLKIDGVAVTSIGGCAFYNCTSLASVTIPNSVTSIGERAFEWCTGLTSIDIPNSVMSIGSFAFAECINLTKVTMAYGVKSIDWGAFSGCKSLTSVTIPNSVTSIGSFAFGGCTGLTSIDIPESVISIDGEDAFGGCTNLGSINADENNPNYSSSDGVLFNKDKTALVRYPAGKADTQYAIPSSVTSVEGRAFANCANLTSVDIPESVTSIGSGVFIECTGLENIDIPNSVTKIPFVAFLGCTGLTSVTIPSSVTSFGYHSFDKCISLEDVYYSGSEAQWNEISNNNAFIDSPNLTIHYNWHTHSYTAVVTPPTCTEQGYTTYTCSCGESYTKDYVSALGHKTEIRGAVAPTCTEAGYTGDEVCTVCGEIVSQGEAIEPTGHHYKGNTCIDCGAHRSTGDTIRAWLQDAAQQLKNFFDKIFGKN